MIGKAVQVIQDKHDAACMKAGERVRATNRESVTRQISPFLQRVATATAIKREFARKIAAFIRGGAAWNDYFHQHSHHFC